MVNPNYDGPVIVVRDAGYSKIELLSPEYRKKVTQRVENPNSISGKYKLKELFAEIGIIVNPEAMTYLYKY